MAPLECLITQPTLLITTGRRSHLENQKVFGAQNSSVSPHGPVQPEVLKRIFSLLCFFCCSPYLTQHMDTELTLILQLDHFPLMSSCSYPFLLHLSEAHPPPHSSRLSTNVPSSMKASPALPDRINSSLPYPPEGFVDSCSTPTIITLNVQSWQSSPLQFTKKVKPHVHSFISPRAPSSTRFPHTLPFTILILPSKGLS